MDSAAVAVAPEVTEFRRQVTVGDLCGDVIKDVIARGLRKRRISRRGGEGGGQAGDTGAGHHHVILRMRVQFRTHRR